MDGTFQRHVRRADVASRHCGALPQRRNRRRAIHELFRYGNRACSICNEKITFLNSYTAQTRRF